MKAIIAIGALVVAAAAAGGGYWLGNRGAASGHGNQAAAAGAAGQTKQERRLLYYRNPMGLPDTSPVPKKDPMGMDYIPVYEGEADAEPSAAGASQIRISTDKIQKLGVRTEAASTRAIGKIVRAAGRIEPDERRVYLISPKFEGYVERLHVSATGQAVAKGQALFEVYSPELVAVQLEYALAVRGFDALKAAGAEAQTGMRQLADASLMRLRNWDISDEQIRALASSGGAKRTLTFRSPVSGIVMEKKAVQGMRFMPGEMLYQVADLSAVWALADVFEQDIGAVKTGARAKVKINAYPDKVFEGTIAYVYPTLKAETRTVQVRIELANPGQLLKPGMFAQLELAAPATSNAVTVPVSAVIDSGTRRMVLVQLQEGRFEPREVRLGASSDDYVEVLDGVKDGEQVVVAANFLIDAESNLKAAVSGFGSAGQAGQAGQAGGANASSGQAAPGHPGAGGVGHKAEGRIDEIDAGQGTVSIEHGPVASLKWPTMTMEFKVANSALLQGLKPGAAVAFEFVERQPGEWVVTGIQAAASGKGSAAPAKPHAGH